MCFNTHHQQQETQRKHTRLSRRTSHRTEYAGVAARSRGGQVWASPADDGDGDDDDDDKSNRSAGAC